MNKTPNIMPSGGSLFQQAVNSAVTKSPVDDTQTKVPTVTIDAPRSNVISESIHENTILKALSSISRIVGRSLGPHGANTLIRSPDGEHIATKDGFTILKHLTFLQEVATMVLDIVTGISRTLVRKVGDGSTSAVIMADSLYQSFLASEVLKTYTPTAVQFAMTALADELAKGINKVAFSVDSHDNVIRNVATITTNNNPHLGEMIAKVYRDSGKNANITVIESDNETTYTKVEPGYRVLRGMVHECFANEVGHDASIPSVCKLTNAKVMIIDGIVNLQVFNSSIVPVLNHCLKKGIGFVLVVKEIDYVALDAVVMFKQQAPSAPLLIVDHATMSRKAKARLGDLACVVDAKVLDSKFIPECSNVEDEVSDSFRELLASCGKLETVVSTHTETVFSVETVSPRVQARADEIKEFLDSADKRNLDASLDDELDEMRSRVRTLLGNQVTFFAGGSSQPERAALTYLIDDAVLAIKSAISTGVVEGLGMTAIRILNDIDSHPEIRVNVVNTIREKCHLSESMANELTQLTIDAFFKAYIMSTSKVLANSRLDADAIIDTCLETGTSYNVVHNSYDPVTPAELTVVNPAGTDIEIIKSAASIVSMFLSSNQTMLTQPALNNGMD